jgi:hypothetical protein
MSGAPEVYQASRIKRSRATKVGVMRRRARLYEIAYEIRPASVRGVYYQASVHGIVEKTEPGYGKVQVDLVRLRRAGVLPYGWITDNTRLQRKPRTYNGIADAVEQTAEFYRKALWRAAGCYVEVWLEKDALSGVVYPVTSLYDVPLMVARGYSSLTFLHSSAEYIAELDVPTFIYHLGDFDPSGVNAGEKIEQTLREMTPDAELHFERLAVLPEQITAWTLPTRPTKQSDTRAKKFGSDISVELDAIDPNRLRSIVQEAIERHLPADELKVLQEAEASERDALKAFAGNMWLGYAG